MLVETSGKLVKGEIHTKYYGMGGYGFDFLLLFLMLGTVKVLKSSLSIPILFLVVPMFDLKWEAPCSFVINFLYSIPILFFFSFLCTNTSIIF